MVNLKSDFVYASLTSTVTGCEEIKNTTTCLAKPECGWCYETKACKTGTMVEPVCNDCNRCQWSSRQALGLYLPFVETYRFFVLIVFLSLLIFIGCCGFNIVGLD